jgi:hypothetical protein
VWDIGAANSVRRYDATVVLIDTGVYNLGLFDLDELSSILANHASTWAPPGASGLVASTPPLE